MDVNKHCHFYDQQTFSKWKITSHLVSNDQNNKQSILRKCGKCEKSVRSNQKGIQCEFCDVWFHPKCINLSNELYNKLSISTESWYCQPCTLPNISDSYFIEKSDGDPDPQIDATTASDVNINSEAEDQHVGDIFENLIKLRKGAPANIICGYLNINSYRNKYEHIVELL